MEKCLIWGHVTFINAIRVHKNWSHPANKLGGISGSTKRGKAKKFDLALCIFICDCMWDRRNVLLYNTVKLVHWRMGCLAYHYKSRWTWFNAITINPDGLVLMLFIEVFIDCTSWVHVCIGIKMWYNIVLSICMYSVCVVQYCVYVLCTCMCLYV